MRRILWRRKYVPIALRARLPREKTMKVFFTEYGYRSVISWECPDCKNFYTCGMDLSVIESIKTHKTECTAKRVPNFRDPKYVLFQRLTRMQRWIELKGPWVCLEAEMKLIMEGFNKL
jgi:hypothetical protein